MGPQYDFGPEGQHFAEPVTILFEYDPKRLPPKKRAPSVRVFTGPAGSPLTEVLPTTRVDATHVSARTTHFSGGGPGVPQDTEDPFDGPWYQLAIFPGTGPQPDRYPDPRSLATAKEAGGAAEQDLPDPDTFNPRPEVPWEHGWNQEVAGAPFRWMNRTQNLLSDEKNGASVYDTKGNWVSGAKGDALVYVFEKPRRATHVEILVTSVMGHVSLANQTLGMVYVTYEDGTVDPLDPLVLGKNLRNDHFFLPNDPAMRLPMAQFNNFVNEASDKKSVCQFKTKSDKIGAVHYAIDRVRLPLPKEAVRKRKKVKKLVVQNIARPVMGPGIANTVAPVVQKVDYSGLQIWGLTLGKEYPIIFVPGIMGTSLSADPPANGMTDEPWPGRLVTGGFSTEGALKAMGFTTGGAPVGPALTKCELMGMAGWQVSAPVLGGFNFYEGIFKFMVDHMGYRPAKTEFYPSQGRCWQEPIAPNPVDDCTLREDLYTFPYDWRLPTNFAANDLKTLVQKIKTRTGADKVDIVAHSLGGIVSRIYLSQGGAADVDTYITLGTPFYGAPKVFSMTRYGQKLTPFFPDQQRRGFKEVSRNMWGVYMLLPSKKYVDQAGPYFTYGGTDVPPYRGALSDEQMTGWLKTAFCGTDWYLPVCQNERYYNAGLVDWARGIHAQIDDWDDASDDAPWKYAIIGTGQSTLVSIGDSPSARGVVHDGAFLDYALRCEDGDGSVAPRSALGFPASVRKHVFIKGEHADLPSNESVQKQVQLFIPGIEQLADGATYEHQGEGTVSDCDQPP